MTAKTMRAHIRRIYLREAETFRAHQRRDGTPCLDACEDRQRVYFMQKVLMELMQTFGMRPPKTD